MNQLSATRWSNQYPNGRKQIVVSCTPGSEMIATRQQYAVEHGYTPLAERLDGVIALYWDRDNRLVRLAIEEVR